MFLIPFFSETITILSIDLIFRGIKLSTISLQHRVEEMKVMASRPFAKVSLDVTDPVQERLSKVGCVTL